MPKPVAISSRWAPGHRIRIDTVAGSYEEVNAPLISAAEADVQAALLARSKPTGYPLLWWGFVILCGAAAVASSLWGPAA
jgi:hypothetical protein